MLKIYLRDINYKVFDAWKIAFNDCEEVNVSHGIICDINADAVVSPANSFGFMDGGIDLFYRNFFGTALENSVREHINNNFYGELIVGQATIVPIGHEIYRYLIVAPTMRVPENVANTVNAYLAFRAALLAVKHFNNGEQKIKSLLCPGLCTTTGRMDANVCARQMRAAYDNYHTFSNYSGLIDYYNDHVRMKYI